MTDDQSGVVKVWLSPEKKVLPYSNNIEEIIPYEMVEKTAHIWLSVEVSEDLNSIDIGEREVTQPSKPSEKEMIPQQIRL